MDTVVASPRAITIPDTGGFALGRHTFERYTTPGQCRAAAFDARNTFMRDVAHVEQELFSYYDTAGLGAAAEVARQCGARFTLATVPKSQWGDLFLLALYEQNDTLAHAILAQQLRQGPSFQSVDQVNLNAFGFGILLAGLEADIREGTLMQLLAFGRYAAAKALLTEVDTKEPDALKERCRLHHQFVEFLRMMHTDSAQMVHEDSVLIQLGTAPGAQAFGYGFTLNAYQDLLRVAVQGDTSKLAALMQNAKRQLGAFTQNQQRVYLSFVFTDWQTSEWSEAQKKLLLPVWYRWQQVHGAHRQAPRVQADFWFPALGHTAHDTLIPMPGKINLICGGGRPTEYRTKNGENIRDEMTTAYDQMVHIKRWLAQYGSAGLTVTFVRAAIGGPWIYQDDRVTRDVFVNDSVHEAEFWHWYDQEYHQLPVTEGVVVIHTTARLPAPDGRRTHVVQTLDTNYFNLLEYIDNPALSPEWGACTLVGRDGTIIYQRNEREWYYLKHWDENAIGTWDDILHWVFAHQQGDQPAPAQPLAQLNPTGSPDDHASTGRH